jgi:Family of unknown function (DUF6107)
MADITSGLTLWGARMIGACVGASVSLVYLLPKNRREAATRFFTGLACGLVFGGPTGVWLANRLSLGNALASPEIMLTGSAAASLLAWWALGALARISERLGR